MKIYGVGLFHAPNSSRVIWDFVDGPFDTVNPVLIMEAKKRGYSFSPPIIKNAIENMESIMKPEIIARVNEEVKRELGEKETAKAKEPIVNPVVAETPKKKPGRPAKVVQDEPS